MLRYGCKGTQDQSQDQVGQHYQRSWQQFLSNNNLECQKCGGPVLVHKHLVSIWLVTSRIVMHSYQYCNVLVLNPTLSFHDQVISHEENQHHAVVYAFFLAGISFNFSHSWFTSWKFLWLQALSMSLWIKVFFHVCCNCRNSMSNTKTLVNHVLWAPLILCSWYETKTSLLTVPCCALSIDEKNELILWKLGFIQMKLLNDICMQIELNWIELNLDS
jgi:hypothetical protein